MHLKTPYLEVSPPPGDDFESSSSFLEEEEDEEEGLPAAAAAAEEGEDAACAAAAAAAAAPLEAAMDRRCWRMPGFKPKKKWKLFFFQSFKFLLRKVQQLGAGSLKLYHKIRIPKERFSVYFETARSSCSATHQVWLTIAACQPAQA